MNSFKMIILTINVVVTLSAYDRELLLICQHIAGKGC